MSGKTFHHAFVGSIAAICLACLPCGAEEAHKDGRFRPDLAVQKNLDALFRRLVQMADDKNTSHAIFDKTVHDGVEQLRTTTHGKLATVIPEIAFYVSAAKDEQIGGIGDLVFGEFVRKADAQETIAVVAPYLFSTEDAQFRGKLWAAVSMVCSKQRPALDFDPIFACMKAHKGEISDNLVRYIYAMSPGEAMLAYMRFSSTNSGWSSEQKELLLAEREISTTLWKQQHTLLGRGEVEPVAAAELKKLSESKRWWVRLYVAEIMKTNPAFRNAAIVERFKKDENPLVRELVAFDKKDGREGGSLEEED